MTTDSRSILAATITVLGAGACSSTAPVMMMRVQRNHQKGDPMGGQPYWYFVPHDESHQRALDQLRTREFEAGRYSPVMSFIDFGPAMLSQRPGPGHASIADAVEAGGASGDGTRSILDVETVGDESDYGVAGRVAPADCERFFGSATPTHAQVERSLRALLGELERGQCVYLVVYENGRPSELAFFGYSYD
jgi:hypothetical protein